MLPVYMLQISNFFSGLSNSIVVITIPWLVLEVTGSPAFAGLVVALSSIPALLISPLSGVFIKRFGNRPVSIAADLFSTLSVIAFPLAALTVGLSGWAILLIALVGAVFDPVGYTARKTLITTVSNSSGYNVEKLNGLHEGLFGVAWIAGPALGAWLIALLGATNSFWVAGVCSAVAALAIAVLRVTAKNLTEDQEQPKASLLIGFRLIWRDKLILAIVASVLILATAYLPTESVVLPSYYQSLGEPTSLGLVISALAGGSAISAFGYGWLIQRISGRSLIRIAFLGASFSTLAMSFLPPLPWMLVGAVVLGLSWGPFNPFMNSVIQRRVPEQEHGMVFGAQSSVFYAAPPIGMVLTGLAVEQFGVGLTYQGLGWLLVIAAIATLLTKSLRSKF